MPRPRLFLIDSYGFIFRAYHARARSNAPPMRTSKGLSTEAIFIFHNMLRRLTAAHKPEYMAAIFESKGKTFREQSFEQYKANRVAMPPDLADQIPYVTALLEAKRIPILKFDGYEADDVIGAMSCTAVERGVDVTIVSSDKDMLQLVNEHVTMLNPMKDDMVFDVAAATEFMGVAPGQVADLLALKGDPIDNIPGAPGIGEKGARDLLIKYGSVENLIAQAAEITKRTQRESLQNNEAQILLSKKLATIDTGVPIEWNLDELAVQPHDTVTLKQLYRDLEFYSLVKELGPSDADSAGDWAMLESEDEVRAYLAGLDRSKPTAILLAQSRPGELALEPSLGVAQDPRSGRAIPARFFHLITPLLEGSITHDVKSLSHELCRQGLQPPTGFRDVMIESFLLNPDPASADLAKISERILDRRLSPAPEQQAGCIAELAEIFDTQLESKPGLRELYQTIELPLADILARMERTGIRVEPSQLKGLSLTMDREIQSLTAEIHSIAGQPFNINSPQQLGKILFEDLKLPTPVKYGKGKQISTAADVLEDLAEEYPIARKVLEYRQLSKLKGTYVDALPQRIDPATGRLHTSFHQTGAATGRLSSSDPNLQNIPIRTELGRAIRAAFVPEPGWRMLIADYSQIELRLLAHLSGDPLLVESFRKGEDIHTRTAAEVFKVPPGQVSTEMRRNAKAVNFGIVYGQTPFGLAAQLGITRLQAETYILNYFERYKGVHDFIQDTIADVRQTGLSRTMFGRERPIPDMHSRNPNARGFAERIAVNTPMQGGAADLIKLAMINIDRRLRDLGFKTRMLLQVHDELVLETPADEAEEAAAMVKHEMESVRELRVPLVAETGLGDNWRDAK